MSEPKIMLKPLFLISPGAMSRRDINRAEKQCGICVVECKETDRARYCERPVEADLDPPARAALSLMRRVMASPAGNFPRGDLTQWFINELLKWDNKPSDVPPVGRKQP